MSITVRAMVPVTTEVNRAEDRLLEAM